MSFMRIWGCQAYVRRQVTDKLGPKSDKCIFVGYPKETKGYYFYNPNEGKVFVARTGVFLEREFVSKGTSGSMIKLDEVQDPQDGHESMDELEQVPQVVARTQPGLQVAEEQQQNSYRLVHKPLWSNSLLKKHKLRVVLVGYVKNPRDMDFS